MTSPRFPSPGVDCAPHRPEIFLADSFYLRNPMSPETNPEASALIPPALDYNITDKELDRDIINLHLPEPDSYVAIVEELRCNT